MNLAKRQSEMRERFARAKESRKSDKNSDYQASETSTNSFILSPKCLKLQVLCQVSDPCWLWIKCINRGGYGLLTLNRKIWRVHRLVYTQHVGPIPAGLSVCHKCDVRNCYNPNHLFLGTHLDNSHDMLAKGRSYGQKKTHCKHGHLYTEANTHWSRGHSICSTCHPAFKPNPEKRRTI